jgi:hypothetical protein
MKENQIKSNQIKSCMAKDKHCGYEQGCWDAREVQQIATTVSRSRNWGSRQIRGGIGDTTERDYEKHLDIVNCFGVSGGGR